jgi:hypothetical protein
VSRQAWQWQSGVANQRGHRETRVRPVDRFRPDALRPLPVIPSDYRDTREGIEISRSHLGEGERRP